MKYKKTDKAEYIPFKCEVVIRHNLGNGIVQKGKKCVTEYILKRKGLENLFGFTVDQFPELTIDKAKHIDGQWYYQLCIKDCIIQNVTIEQYIQEVSKFADTQPNSERTG